MNRRLLPLAVAVLGLVAAGGLYWFQPWRLFTDTTVTDTLTVTPSAAPQPSTASASASNPPVAVVIARGSFVTHEHDTTGQARLVRNPDGSHQLELAGLNTSDGPDLRVWLTDQPVKTGRDGWHVFDDGKYTELGRLKGNRGDQIYALRADIDPSDFRSVSIWCKRFSVSFGAAALA
ncbi:DM13 domain-containing protein [Actinoplanes sp. NPDC049596]|uniref:DM13 domain-containing protein n=1 Tax=unclassified Actinoplanes TaxID=2626549 RepID=UPI003427E406